MIVGRPIVYCGNGAAGTLNTLYPGTCVASPSPGATVADLAVPGVGNLFSVQQTPSGPGQSNTQPVPGMFWWNGSW